MHHRHLTRLRRAPLLALVFALSACGGGGGGGVVSSPTPKPTPTPTPTPTPAPTPTATISVQGETINGNPRGLVTNVEKSPLSVTYDSSASTYTISGNGYSNVFPAGVGNTSPYGTIYRKSVGGNRQDLLVTAKGSSGTLTYQDVQTAMMINNPSVNTTLDPGYVAAVFGTPTPMIDVPVNGQGTYAIEMLALWENSELYGTGTFNLDFDSMRFRFGIDQTIDAYGNAQAWDGLVGNGTVNSAGQFTGDIRFNYDAGTIEGRLFGSNAHELGATFLTNPEYPPVSGTIMGRKDGAVAAKNFTLGTLRYDENFATAPTFESRYIQEANGPTIMYIGTSRSTGRMSYDADTKAWSGLLDNGTALTTFDETQKRTSDDGYSWLYYDNNGHELTLFKSDSDFTPVKLTYVSFATFTTRSQDPIGGQTTYTKDYLPFGVRTVIVPRSGSAAYHGYLAGMGVGYVHTYDITGAFDMTADFSNLALSGSMSLSGKERINGDIVDFGTLNLMNGTLNPYTNTITGTLPSIYGNSSGDVTGSFYGPGAEEIGGTFSNLVRNDPLSDGNFIVLGGAFVGKK